MLSGVTSVQSAFVAWKSAAAKFTPVMRCVALPLSPKMRAGRCRRIAWVELPLLQPKMATNQNQEFNDFWIRDMLHIQHLPVLG